MSSQMVHTGFLSGHFSYYRSCNPTHQASFHTKVTSMIASLEPLCRLPATTLGGFHSTSGSHSDLLSRRWESFMGLVRLRWQLHRMHVRLWRAQWIFTCPLTGVSSTKLENFLLSLWDGRGGRICRVQVSRVDCWEFESQSSQAYDLPNWYLSLPSLTLGINRIGHELVSSVS